MARVLLTVSGVIDPALEQQITDGQRPVPDYVAMARAFSADVIDYAEARRSTGWVGAILERIGGLNARLAWACFRRRRQYDVLFTDGEQVGIPLALLLKLAPTRRPRHLMIVHVLTVPKKLLLFDLFGLQAFIDTFIVYASRQKELIQQRLKVGAERVFWTPFMVDARFFTPRPPAQKDRRMIATAGLEFRDYATLMEAVKDVDVDVVIAAASPWSKRPDRTANTTIPANVHVQRFSQFELRQVYADSQFVVMPLEDVDFQAGVTAILEAMAMERPVICSRTRGQTDILVDGETGIYVAPGDPHALRAAIERLLGDPNAVERMGRASRAEVERRLSQERYVGRLAAVVYSSAHTDTLELK